MHPKTTSKEHILAAARELAHAQGLAALQIRAVAAQAGISVGSVYQYFPHKADLLAAVVASVWQEIFHGGLQTPTERDFCRFLEDLFRKLKEGAKQYSGFFQTHREIFSGNDKDAALQQRQQIYDHIRQSLLGMLEKDPLISSAAFSHGLTKEELAAFSFRSLLLLLSEDARDCHVLTVLLRRALYPPKAGEDLW
ncbi:TetR/AcrR family transcriptional regulator [Anaerotignum lactatifermentans]|uniref:TetR/AcrR family transcriptional regulator n=1 Tax=Anaerotignum lactatifermentans TaxID=160404 RepID=A0ABS2GC77_9FIRM|nr:TetR/AcrR family transcriptional regulator [Anaerotignum lactatifermentans]MBM6829595.1 TetR/AcrR family transcriptional regulator [Anaerotignum lactatifermentans]MBM6878089.1 TetR/AcrR family transcriptional regulator [Anaerotignum lactatifermentans]MBM6951081.1 TetR/AcrR family transcriptional regulator [Anaerotignum lactatifermentans]